MPTLMEIEAKPEFASLSFEEQTRIRSAYFDQKVMTNPDFTLLPDNEKQKVFNLVVQKAPVLETPESDYMRKAAESVNRMKLGDMSGVDEAIGLSSFRTGTKQMLLPTLATKGIDAIANLFDPNYKNDPLFEDYYGKDGEKTDQWLQMQISIHGGDAAIKKLKSNTFMIGAGGSFAEFALMTLALHGIGSAIGSAVGATMAGTGGMAASTAKLGAQIGRGVLTGEYANAATMAALQGTKLSSPLIKNLLALTVEGVQSGVTQTGLDVLRLGLQHDFEHKTNNEIWSTIANNYGMNIAMNYIGWGIMKTAGIVGKAGLKALKSVKLEKVDDFIEAFLIETNPVAKTATREYVEEVLGPQEARLRMSKIGPKDDAGLAIINQYLGWDTEFNKNGTVTMRSLDGSNVVLENLDRRTAARRTAEIWHTGTPAIEMKPKDLETTLRGHAIGAARDSQIVKKTAFRMKDMTPDRVATLLYPENGVVNPTRMTAFGRIYLRSQGVDSKIVNDFNVPVGDVPSVKAPVIEYSGIILPRKVTNLVEEEKLVNDFIDALDGIVTKNTKHVAKTFTMALPPLENHASSFKSVEIAAHRLGLPVEMTGHNSIKLLGQTFTTPSEANGAILHHAIESGKMSVEQLSAVMQNRFGYSLKLVDKSVFSETGPAKRLVKRIGGDNTLMEKAYVVSKPVAGKTPVQIASAPDIGTLLHEHPELDPSLPTVFAPDFWIVDPKLKTISFQETIATGNATELLELSGNFTMPQTTEIIEKIKADSIHATPGSTHFIIKNDNLGAWAEFDSITSAQSHLRKVSSEIEKLEGAFGMRDMRVFHRPDGGITALSPDGSFKNFAMLKDAEAWLRATPYADWMKELLPVTPTLLKEATEQIANVSKKLAAQVPDRKGLSNILDKPLAKTSRYFAPTEMALEAAKRVHDNPALINAYHRIKAGFRLVQEADNKADALISNIFHKVSYDDKIMYHILVGQDESRWADIAEKGFKKTLTEENILKLHEIQKFYDAAFTASGIPDWKRVMSYAPRIRDWVSHHAEDITDAISAKEYLTRMFGTTPTGFEFFGLKARATELIRIANFEDAEQVMRSYTYALNKHRLMDTLLKTIDNDVKGLEGQFQKSELDFFLGAIDEMQSATKTRQQSMFKTDSKNAILHIQKILQAVPGLRSMPIANNPVIGDIVDLFNSQVTVATQAKPWVMFRQLSQVYLLGAAMGDNVAVMKALKSVLEEPADDTIKSMLKTGAVQGADFIGSHGNSQLGFWRQMMKFGSNMDIITRATAFKAAENVLDENLPYLVKGSLSTEGFIKRTGLSILDDQTRLIVLDAVNRHDMKFAADTYGDALNRLTLFDYSKINRPTFMRGAMGKVLGKFGTYPASALSLYGRILTSGSAAERVARSARIVLTSMAIYEGAKAMGVSYSGFLWTDPFAYQGGPLWHMLSDGSQIIGDSNQAKQARASILRDLPRIISPEMNTAYQIKKALEYLDKGDTYSAAIALTGAPVRRDQAWVQRRY